MTNNNDENLFFLTVEDVTRLHDISIDREGGNPGVKEPVYLESAVMQAQQRMYGQYLHDNVEAMAAAYMFHICQNHAFQDGNKRAALTSAQTFLDMNGKELTLSNEEAFGLVTLVASGKINKQQLTEVFQNNTRPMAVEKQETATPDREVYRDAGNLGAKWDEAEAERIHRQGMTPEERYDQEQQRTRRR